MDALELLALAATAWLAVYAFAAWVWPFTACRKCHGGGKLRSPSGRNWRRCKRCGGTGRRLRLGRKIVNHLSYSAREASSADDRAARRRG